MSEKSRSVVAHMLTSVAAISSASASAEALLNQTSNHIRDITSNVDSSNQDDVDQCLDQLESFADQLDQQASELSAAVTANTPSDQGANGGGTVSNGGDTTGSGDAPHPETIEGAAAAGGYSTTSSAPVSEQTPLPPAAGQHPDQPIDETKGNNSTLTDTQPGGPENQNADGSNADQTAGADQSSSSGSDQSAGSGEGQAADSADSADAQASSGSGTDSAAAEASSPDNNDAA